MNLIVETKEDIKEDEPKEEDEEVKEIKQEEPNVKEKEIIDDPNKIILLEEMTTILKEQISKKIHLIITIGALWMYIITLNLMI